jgi:hypothetical protein
MGLFDSWRRKKKPVAAVQLTELKQLEKVEIDASATDSQTEPSDIVSLVATYERLVRRREDLQVERRELIESLDRGELDPDEFQKNLMRRIQEASTVSESLRVVAIKLTALGYRGVLH